MWPTGSVSLVQRIGVSCRQRSRDRRSTASSSRLTTGSTLRAATRQRPRSAEPNDPAQQPAHAGETFIPRRTVIRVAGRPVCHLRPTRSTPATTSSSGLRRHAGNWRSASSVPVNGALASGFSTPTGISTDEQRYQVTTSHRKATAGKGRRLPEQAAASLCSTPTAIVLDAGDKVISARAATEWQFRVRRIGTVYRRMPTTTRLSMRAIVFNFGLNTDKPRTGNWNG